MNKYFTKLDKRSLIILDDLPYLHHNIQISIWPCFQHTNRILKYFACFQLFQDYEKTLKITCMSLLVFTANIDSLQCLQPFNTSYSFLFISSNFSFTFFHTIQPFVSVRWIPNSTPVAFSNIKFTHQPQRQEQLIGQYHIEPLRQK